MCWTDELCTRCFVSLFYNPPFAAEPNEQSKTTKKILIQHSCVFNINIAMVHRISREFSQIFVLSVDMIWIFLLVLRNVTLILIDTHLSALLFILFAYVSFFSFSKFFSLSHQWLTIDFLTNERILVYFLLTISVRISLVLFVSLYTTCMCVCVNIFFEIENNFSDFYKWVVSLCRTGDGADAALADE